MNDLVNYWKLLKVDSMKHYIIPALSHARKLNEDLCSSGGLYISDLEYSEKMKFCIGI